MASPLFVDTSYILGLYNTGDQFHQICKKALSDLQATVQLYITDAILFEIGNAFSSVDRRIIGGEIIRALLNDPHIQIVHLNPEYFEQTLELFEMRSDKDWGMVDCFSFIIMKEFRIKAALTTDRHFKQAGFKILPF